MWPSLRDAVIMMSLVLCVAAATQAGLRNPNDANAALIEEDTWSLARFQAKWAPVARPESELTNNGRAHSDVKLISALSERVLERIDGRRSALPLSDEQRSRIYEGVMRIPDAPVAIAPAPDLADALPGGVPLQDLPQAVIEEIPLVLGHKFVKLDDRILVVDPGSRMVVAMIPRYKLLQ